MSGDNPAWRVDPDSDQAIGLWVLTMRARGLANRTVKMRESTLRAACRRSSEQPLALTTEGVATYLAEIDTQATRRIYYVTLKAWSTWLLQSGRRADDPMLMLPSPKVPRYEPRPITTPQLRAVLRSRMHARTRAMILLGAYEGMRVHEIAKLRGEDLDLDGLTIRIVGKGGVAVTLPLHPVVAALAAGYPARGWWFPAYTGERGHITGQGITTTVSKAMRRAGVDATAHTLRHWFATELVRSGADLRTVQSVMRHSSLQTTAIYTQVADETRAQAMLGLPHVAPGPYAHLRVVQECAADNHLEGTT